VRVLLCLFALTAAVACAPRTPGPVEVSPRDELLAHGFAARVSDPLTAASLFERAGPGASLERARLDAWLGCLERGAAGPDAWLAVLAAGPPEDLRAAALEGLGRARLAAGERDGGVAALEEAARSGRVAADEALLEAGDAAARDRAALRLAVRSPQRLQRLDPDLQRETLRRLQPAQWLERARAWRRVGLPSRAEQELRQQRWSGAEERERRDEMVEAAVAAGLLDRALAALGSGSEPGLEGAIRAERLRRQGWGQTPGPAARRLFAQCLVVAERAAAEGSGRVRARSLELVLECGTEGGELGPALAAWRTLQGLQWESDRRDWLGRRLGLALASRPGHLREVEEVGAGVPDHRRCLRYRLAQGGAAGNAGERLADLARAPFADLYAVWAREDLGLPTPPPMPPPIPRDRVEETPATVRQLLEWGAPEEAVREWRRLRRLRGLTPWEGVAAARLERERGNANEAIACLRSVLPELGRVDMDRAPAEAIRAYLPLDWQRPLVTAARVAGVDPWLLAAVARQESVFRSNAVSPAGARGVLQLLPGTARPHAVALGLGPHPDLFDPEHNLRLGARELGALLRRFGAVEPALAAYNAGEGRARRWWRSWPDRRRFTEEVPIPETYTYIRRVSYLAEAYRLSYGEEWRQP
jgi:soluble lytic murein transglycosylase-like protein